MRVGCIEFLAHQGTARIAESTYGRVFRHYGCERAKSQAVFTPEILDILRNKR